MSSIINCSCRPILSLFCSYYRRQFQKLISKPEAKLSWHVDTAKWSTSIQQKGLRYRDGIKRKQGGVERRKTH